VITPEQLIAAIVALVGIVQGLSAVVYRELKAQIADRDRRILALEAAAAEAVRAKDAEIAEWRRAFHDTKRESQR